MMKSLYFKGIFLLLTPGVAFGISPDKPLYGSRTQTYCNGQCKTSHYLESIYEQSNTDYAASNHLIYEQSDTAVSPYTDYLYDQPCTNDGGYSESTYAESTTSCDLYAAYVHYVDTRTPALPFHITTSDASNQIKYNLVVKENVDGKRMVDFHGLHI